MRSGEERLFLSNVTPFRAISSKTLARWLSELMTLAGVDTTTFKPHSTRGATIAYLRDRALTVQQICAIADWSSSSGVFEKFYLRYVNK